MLSSWPPAYRAGRSFSVRRLSFYSCPLPQPLLCNVPGLAAFQSYAGCSAPPVQPPPQFCCLRNRAWLSLQRPRGVRCINLLPYKSSSVVPKRAARSDLSLYPKPGLLAAG